jgi:DNA repair exonuclease SbcCD ATPase subunit
MAEPAYWITGAAVLVSIIALGFSVLRQPHWVSASSAAELRELIHRLERRIDELERGNANLTSQNSQLLQQNDAILREREWWQTSYREIKERYDRISRESPGARK